MMHKFSNHQIAIATSTDIVSIKNLLNNAYRGEASKKGWTTEAHLIAGNVRTDEKNVWEVMQTIGSVFLKYVSDDGIITGCVNLQKNQQKIYLGMFGVKPNMQNAGIGKSLLKAAEEHAKQLHCTSIYMSVISVRTELISWYQKHGYMDTNERKPFIEDGLTGKHLQPLEFLVLEKML